MALEYVRSFKELRVYQKSRAVSRAVFKLSKQFPKEEMYSLTDQFRRAARSIGAQIAEYFVSPTPDNGKPKTDNGPLMAED